MPKTHKTSHLRHGNLKLLADLWFFDLDSTKLETAVQDTTTCAGNTKTSQRGRVVATRLTKKFYKIFRQICSKKKESQDKSK